jgi:hypothetical protein
MALPGNHVLFTQHLVAYSPSVGASPVAAYVRAPFRAQIRKVTCILGGTLTADATVTVAVNGTSIGTFVMTAAGSVAGTLFTSFTPTTNTLSYVNEDDVVSFTSASGTGASIPGNYSCAFRAS